MGLHKLQDLLPTSPQQVAELMNKSNQNKSVALRTGELTAFPSGETRSLIETVNNDPKIETLMRQGQTEGLVQALRYSMLIVGIREQNFPKEEEAGVLIEFIRRHYGGHTVKEIRLAFEMAIAGKLDVDSRAFENFSIQYFSSIMNSYRKWAAQEYRQHAETRPKQTIDKLSAYLNYARARLFDYDRMLQPPLRGLLQKKKLLN